MTKLEQKWGKNWSDYHHSYYKRGLLGGKGRLPKRKRTAR